MSKAPVGESKVEGKATSYWLDSTPETGYPSLPGDSHFDTVIIGGGIAGLALALMLKEAGQNVAVVELHRIASDVTGHTTAKITSLHSLKYGYLIDKFGREEARMYAEAQQAAIEKIDDIVTARDIDCDFVRASAYTCAVNESQLRKVEKEVEAAQSLGLPVTYTESTELHEEVKGAVLLADQAKFHPRRYLLALAKEIDGEGGHIFEETKVTHVDEGRPCTVQTDKGTVTADDVVVTTNYPFMISGFYFARIFPRRSYVLGVKIKGEPPTGMYITADEDNFHSYRSTPTAHGELLLFGGQAHKAGHGGDVAERYQKLEADVRSLYEVESIDYHWSTQDNYSADRVPYIGQLTWGSHNTWVATAFGGWGMTNSHISAMILSDLIQGKENSWATVFDSTRIKPIASAPALIKEGIDIVEDYIRSALPKARESFDEIPQGQGKVIEHAGRRLAVYKNEQGQVTTLSPICQHLGCVVGWNNADDTWDCPCHGSRYDRYGRVIHGPSQKDLPRVHLEEE